MNKRFLSALLALCMVFSLLPAAAQAVDPVIDTEAELNAAVVAVTENGTVTLGGNIELALHAGEGGLTASSGVNVPNTGESDMHLPAVLFFFAIACGIGAAVYRKKRTQA